MRKIKLSTETELKILDLIDTHTRKEIGKKIGVSANVVTRILNDNNIKPRGRFRLNRNKLYVDIDYFKNIDTPKKAYWLGYIAADGTISKINARCGLTSKDLEIIKKFKSDIQSEHKISENVIKDKRTGNISIAYTIQITNINFVLNLNKHGITKNKADIFNVPNINEKLLSYFFAGLFDGDGYVGLNKKRFRVSLISTNEVLSFLQNYLLNNFYVKPTKLQKVSENKTNVWKLLLYKGSLSFLNWIYSDSEFSYLSRKYYFFINNKNIVMNYMSKPYVRTNNKSKKKVINLDTKEIYESITEASKILNIPMSTLSFILSGKIKSNLKLKKV